VIAGLFWAPRPAAADHAPTAFIGSLGQQVLAVIHRPDLPVDGKAAYFRQLLRQDFDLTGISRFVLGPYWRVASPGERQEFSDLLTQQIIDVYDRRLAQAGDGNFVVSGSRTDPGGVIVTSRIIPGRARRSLWIGGSRSATAITRSRVSPSTGSAWR
jgi:phospholipid transport system substrate-binding protein